MPQRDRLVDLNPNTAMGSLEALTPIACTALTPTASTALTPAASRARTPTNSTATLNPRLQTTRDLNPDL